MMEVSPIGPPVSESTQHTKLRMDLLLYLGAGAAIGFFAWGNGQNHLSLAWSLLLPLAWGMAPTRSAAALLVLGYYLVGARGLPIGAVVFFGEDAPAAFGWSLWFASSLVLTAPFTLLWSKSAGNRPLRFGGAVCLSAIPPLAFIGWLNPLTAAGAVFPGLGWAGLVLLLLLMGALVARSLKYGIALGCVALVSNLMAGPAPSQAPPGWVGVDTTFPRLASAGTEYASQVLASMDRVQWLIESAKDMPADSVLVLPETVLGSLDGVAEFSLQDTQAALATRGSRILIGAELPQPDGEYKNVVKVLGAKPGEDQVAMQSIPIPVAMWKPWASNGAVADLLGGGNTVVVKGRRVGVAVCYEQVLAYSLWRLMLDRPDLIVAVSNVWWARTTSIPDIQRQSVAAFGRLFDLPVITARNI